MAVPYTGTLQKSQIVILFISSEFIQLAMGGEISYIGNETE